MKWSRKIAFLLLASAAIAGALVWRQQHTAARRLAAWNNRRLDEAIFALLDKPIDLGRQPMTLKEFAARITKMTGIDVVIDADATQMATTNEPFPHFNLLPVTLEKLPIETPWSLLPARSHLALALEAADLCWLIERGQLVITTRETADNRPLTVVTYPLPQPDHMDSPHDGDQWAETICRLIEPRDWKNLGGSGYCEAVGGALLIAHRPQVHRQIKSLFDRLKAAYDPPRTWQAVPIWPGPDAAANAEIRQRLTRPASIDCDQMPLEKLVAFLSQEHEIPLALNVRKLNEAGVSPQSPVTKKLFGISLGSLIRHVLKDVELTYAIREGVLLITTPEDAESHLLVVGYPVHDLLVPTGYQGLGPSYRDYDSLIELLTATIKPDSWDDVGGPSNIPAIAGWLFVSQTEEAHAQIERLFRDMRRTLGWSETPMLFARPDDRETEARILAALKRPLGCTYQHTRLRDLCTDIATQLEIPVLVQRNRLEEAGVISDTRIHCEFPVAPASVQLRRILEPQELTTVVCNEAIVITTPEDADEQLLTRVYDVRGLLEDEIALFDSHDYDSLIALISNHVRADSWHDAGGPGAIDSFPGLLIVSQTREVHVQLDLLLSELRRAMLWRGEPQEMPPTLPTPAEQHMRTALEKEISLNYIDTSLTAVARDLSQRLEIPIYVSENRLQLAGVGGDLVTSHFSAALASVQLARLCKLLELDFFVSNDLLTITTRETTAAALETRAYDVRRILKGWAGIQRATGDEFESMVMKQVSPESWHPVGGPRHVTLVRGFLIVSQTQANHGRIETLLRDLRDYCLP